MIEKDLLQFKKAKYLLLALAALILLTLVSMILLSKPAPDLGVEELKTFSAEVKDVQVEECLYLKEDNCFQVYAELKEGAVSNQQVKLELANTAPYNQTIDANDNIIVAKGINGTYEFVQFDRSSLLIYFFLAFVICVLLSASFKGLRALLGLLLSILIIFTFTLPSILGGGNPLLITATSALAVLFSVILVTHGITRKSLASLITILPAIILLILLAIFITNSANITGLQEGVLGLDDTLSLDSIKWLFAASVLITTLGVLDDVVLSQVSTTFALSKEMKDFKVKELTQKANEVGRDHLSSAVNTMALAYVGTSLLALLVFSVRDVSLTFLLSYEEVILPILGLLISSIIISICLPFSSLIASLFIKHFPSDKPQDHHHHHH